MTFSARNRLEHRSLAGVLSSQRRIRVAASAALVAATLPLTVVGSASVDAAGDPVIGEFFVDLDRDGARDAGEDLAPGDALYPSQPIAVDAFDADGGTVACLVTGAGYTCDVSGLVGTDFRIEFSLRDPDIAAGFSSTVRGPDSASNTQFVSAGSVADFGVTPPSQCPTSGAGFADNPNSAAGKLWTTCYVNGDREIGTPADTFVGFNYDGSGDIEKLGLKGGDGDADESDEVGSLWGVAYDEWTSTIFTSAVIRRHADLGSEGLDGVYWVSYPAGTWNSVSLSDLAGAPSYGADLVRDIAGNGPTTPFHDVEAYGAVGRRGIGDIDVTPDGRTLVVSNLSTTSVDVYDVSNAAAGGDPTFVRSVGIADPGCAGDDGAHQVWALNALDSTNVHVGVTCTGEGATVPGDLQAFVLPVDISATPSVGAALVTVPLGYLKSCESTCTDGETYTAWTDTFATTPQALLSDIDLTSDGSMVLGIMDRNSMQRSQNNYRPDVSNTTDLDYAVSNGDLLHACNTSGDPQNPTYVIETVGNADCDPSANFADAGGGFISPDAHAGPGGLAEWYGEERILGGIDHLETAQGGIFVDPYGDEVVVSSMNPDGQFEAGGVAWYDTNTGAKNDGLNLFGGPAAAGFSGKATGIGDVEGCTLPIEIGDRVWLDADRDGIQDGGEVALAGVTVMLLDAGDVVVATTTTGPDGTYTFATIDGLLPDTAYSLMFDVLTMTNTGDLPAGVTPDLLTETVVGAGDSDDADSDLVGGKIPFTSPAAGTNDHSFDAGYIAPQFEYRIGSLVWLDANDDGIADGGDTPLAGITVQLLDSAGAVIGDTITNGRGEYVFDGLESGTYRVNIPGDQTLLAGLTTSGTPNPDADGPGGVGVDNDNNGVATSGDFISGPVTLGEGSSIDEPVGEASGIDGVSNEDGTYPDGRSNQTIDFGFADKPALELGNFVWIDADNNGEFDAGEVPVEGVAVELVDSDGNVLQSDETDASGNYLFTDLAPGDYVVRLPASNFAAGAPLVGYHPSSGAAASNDPNDDVDDNSDGVRQSDGSITSGTVSLEIDGEPTADDAPSTGTTDENSNLTVDFGFYTLTLGDTVWFDTDNSGTLDAGEDTAPAGVTVSLIDSSGTVAATTTTDADGMYLFDGLMEGDYIVRIGADEFAPGALLEGYISSTGNGVNAPDPDDDVDDDDNGTPLSGGITSGTITLDAGDEPVDGDTNPTVDFGLIPSGSIGSLFFEDFDADGQFGPGDEGIGGVTVRLLDEGGLVIATTTTDADGTYLFDNLPPGKYIVEFVPPAGRVLTVSNRGNDATDSDADVSTGRTGVIMLGLGDDDLDNDAGVTPVVLPATGSDSTTWTLQLAFGLVVVGALIALGARRRRSLRVW